MASFDDLVSLSHGCGGVALDIVRMSGKFEEVPSRYLHVLSEHEMGALLVRAAEIGDLSLMQRALERVPALAGSHGEKALTKACAAGKCAAVKFLADRGVDVDHKEGAALATAVRANKTALARELLVRHGATLYESHIAALCETLHVGMLRVLVRYGALLVHGLDDSIILAAEERGNDKFVDEFLQLRSFAY